jgi:hypothetical protein
MQIFGDALRFGVHYGPQNTSARLDGAGRLPHDRAPRALGRAGAQAEVAV